MNDNGGGSTRSIHCEWQNNSGERTDLDLLEDTQAPLKRGNIFTSRQFSILSFLSRGHCQNLRIALWLVLTSGFSQRGRSVATERQLEANRANAKRSTGPKSLLGKARSRMNACNHGLTAQTIVLEDEDPAQFDVLSQALEEEFEPHSLMERELVERLAGIMWRIRRIPKFEAALIATRCEEVRHPGTKQR
jgi:hypothetical protein